MYIRVSDPHFFADPDPKIYADPDPGRAKTLGSVRIRIRNPDLHISARILGYFSASSSLGSNV